MKRSVVFLGILALTVPLLFMGCSGDDGATGATGAAGPPGAPGPGVAANETCVLCHGTGKTYDPAALHLTTALVPLNITGVAYTDNGANKVVTVSFDYAGTVNILDNSSATQLRTPRFYIAKLVAPGSGEPNTWVRVANGERVNGNLIQVDADSYTYQFNYNVPAADQGLTHRVGIYFSGAPLGSIVKFATNDSVPSGAAVTVTRNIVSTAGCQQCHDPLGFNPDGSNSDNPRPGSAFHSGARNQAEACGICHRIVLGDLDNSVLSFNPETGLVQGTGEAFYPYMVHKIHASGSEQAEDLGVTFVFDGKDYSKITYPQDVRNCKTCHKGDPDGDNWKNRPSMAACGACHATINWVTGANHLAGAQDNNAGCAGCHSATAIERYHATANKTPNNPQLNGGLVTFAYFIDNVTVNASNQAVVDFRITKDGTPVNLKDNTALTGFSFGPSFLVAYGNNVTNPQDYSNFGMKAGQPASVTLLSLLPSLTSTDNVTFKATLASAPFPAGAKMRAVALQGYFTQLGVDDDGKPATPAVDVGRHTPSVMKEVTGDATRRKIIKSGYDPVTGQPVGCLECHEFFEGHGGNRVNNVQVCVMCHNPSLTTSGRSAPASATLNPPLPTVYPGGPLTYPEVSNNLKDMIHGIHGAFMRGTKYEDMRLRSGAVTYYPFFETTYPGDLRRCTKCHEAGKYDASLPLGVDLSTTKVTTGNASETSAAIDQARTTVPNTTDLVTAPTAAACGMCHDSETDISHFLLNGGKVNAVRSTTEVPLPTMSLTGVPAP